MFPGDSGNFPRSLGTLRKVLAVHHKATRIVTKIMGFWRKKCKKKMGKQG